MSSRDNTKAALKAATDAYIAYVKACAAVDKDSKDFYGATVSGRSFKDFLDAAFEYVDR